MCDIEAKTSNATTGGDLRAVWDRVVTESLDRIELLRSKFDVERYELAVRLIGEARQTWVYGFAASFVVAEHMALKLRRRRLLADVEVLLDRARTVGATTILVSDQLVADLESDVTVALHAPNTPTGLTGEPLTPLVVADALAQAVAAAADQERTVEAHTRSPRCVSSSGSKFRSGRG